MQLADHVALITGSARGIGRATARRLAQEGANMVIADINAAGAEEAAAEIEDLGRQAIAVHADVTHPTQVQAMVQRAIDTFGRLDILVNTTFEEWDRTIKIHLYGTFLCTQAAVRHMVTRRYGRIVNISSVSGLVGSAGRAAYGAAKGGIITLTRVLAVELATQGIRVNAIAPGAVETELSRTAWTPADREGYFRLTPVERLGQPEDIAHAVLFLCLPQSDYITGQVLAVDGGFAIAGIQWK
jgi:3-oxoacyl-[acyl-carrier protein] reductase